MIKTIKKYGSTLINYYQLDTFIQFQLHIIEQLEKQNKSIVITKLGKLAKSWAQRR